MAQQIPDRLQRHVRTQQTDRSRETESVSTVSSLHLDASLLEPPLDDGMQRAAPGKRAMRRPHTQEHFADFGLWPAPTEIVQQRIPDGREQRQKRFDAGFRLSNTQSFSPPVDIVEPQANHFAGSQAIGGEQHQNGVVASPVGVLSRRVVSSSAFTCCSVKARGMSSNLYMMGPETAEKDLWR